MDTPDLEGRALSAIAFAASAAASRIVPGRGLWPSLKRMAMRWVLVEYFSHSIRPASEHLAETPRRRVDAEAAIRILAALDGAEGPISRGQLASMTETPGVQANRIFADLHRRGLVELGRNTVALASERSPRG